MKYKVGDKVRIRSDLEVDSYYGNGIYYSIGLDSLKDKPFTIKAEESCWYIATDVDGGEWEIKDCMIKGYWQEKLKLIDILNKIANGELKEGTKVKWDIFEYTYKKGDCYEEYLERKVDNFDYVDILDDMYLRNLNAEVEIIEPNHFTDVGKMVEHLPDGSKVLETTECEHEWNKYSIGRLGRTENYRRCKKCGIHEEDIEPTECNHIWDNRLISAFSKEKGEIVKMKECRKCGKWEENTDNTKIEELDILEIENSQNIDNIGLANSIGDLRNEIREIQHKFNEVIRYINKED